VTHCLLPQRPSFTTPYEPGTIAILRSGVGFASGADWDIYLFSDLTISLSLLICGCQRCAMEDTLAHRCLSTAQAALLTFTASPQQHTHTGRWTSRTVFRILRLAHPGPRRTHTEERPLPRPAATASPSIRQLVEHAIILTAISASDIAQVVCACVPPPTNVSVYVVFSVPSRP
jgi:hypothetical protein